MPMRSLKFRQHCGPLRREKIIFPQQTPNSVFISPRHCPPLSAPKNSFLKIRNFGMILPLFVCVKAATCGYGLHCNFLTAFKSIASVAVGTGVNAVVSGAVFVFRVVVVVVGGGLGPEFETVKVLGLFLYIFLIF